MLQPYIINQSVKCFQRKQAEDNTRATAPPAVPDEDTSAEFTEIPLSLPYQNPEEERQELDPQLRSTAHSSDELSDKLETSSSLTTSLSNIASQSNQTKHHPVDLTESSRDGGVVRQDEEPKATEDTADLEKDTKLRNQPRTPIQFHIPNAPTAPALYPSLATLEESSEIHLCEENVKYQEWETAVLALPEQESSPPGLQLQSVAEISRSKLYPELPKTAPEMQVTYNAINDNTFLMVVKTCELVRSLFVCKIT